ncbi:hypothetical protein KP509_15G074800 [Ceratopteris richardii]|nr:hypothetical protein KP509_15G074800 [Ceratopteris richardii]
MGATFPLMMVGLATVICLLFISFGVLLCCYYKLLTAPQAAPSRAAADRTLFDTFNDALKESSSSQDEAAASSKEVVVIMAGNNTPTFVAFPAFVQESTSKQVPLA